MNRVTVSLSLATGLGFGLVAGWIARGLWGRAHAPRVIELSVNDDLIRAVIEANGWRLVPTDAASDPAAGAEPLH